MPWKLIVKVAINIAVSAGTAYVATDDPSAAIAAALAVLQGLFQQQPHK